MRDIAFDAETWLIAPGRLAPRLVCLSHCDATGAPVLLDRDEGLDWLELRLAEPETRFVGHNVAYDFGVCCEARPSLLPAVFGAYAQDRVADTGVREMLRKIAHGWLKFDPRTNKKPLFNLAALVEEYFAEHVAGKSGDDAWRFRYHELDGVPLAQWPREAVEYAREDARWTWRVWQWQEAKGPTADLFPQCRAAWMLHLMSAWGMRTDPAAVDALEATLQGHVDAAMDLLVPAGLCRRNKDGSTSRNLKVVQDRVAAAYRGAPPMTAPSTKFPLGQVKTADEVLEATPDELLNKLAEIGQDQKELSTYVPWLRRGKDLPVNPGFNVLVESGRTSCKDPNIQNQPRRKGVRECFVPRPGRIFIGCDYAQAELYAMAQVLCDFYGRENSAMACTLRGGTELHLLLAGDILGIGYDEAVRRKQEKEIKDARQIAKAGNFGFLGGLGPDKFSLTARKTWGVYICGHGTTPGPEHNKELSPKGVCLACVTDAKALKKTWLSRFPEMEWYFRDVGAWVAGGGGSFVAEQQRSLRVRGDLQFNDGCNTFFQGLVADGAKAAGFDLARACYVENTALRAVHARPVAFVHDEYIVEVDDDLHLGAKSLARAAAVEVGAIQVAAMLRFTPDVPSRAEPYLMRRWYKGAEPEYRDGLLVPWEPTT